MTVNGMMVRRFLTHIPFQSAVSNIVEDALHTLARKHVTTRFVKLHYLDAEMDEIAVPGILAYKGGDCFSNLMSIMSELPAGREMNPSSLESILERSVKPYERPGVEAQLLTLLPDTSSYINSPPNPAFSQAE